VLEAAGGVDRLVLEVDVDPPLRRQRERVQVGVRRAVGVGFDAPDGLRDPGAGAVAGTVDGFGHRPS
jgi:hypothetical protein